MDEISVNTPQDEHSHIDNGSVFDKKFSLWILVFDCAQTQFDHQINQICDVVHQTNITGTSCFIPKTNTKYNSFKLTKFQIKLAD